jgi:hypothetical protein
VLTVYRKIFLVMSVRRLLITASYWVINGRPGVKKTWGQIPVFYNIRIYWDLTPVFFGI